MVMLLVLAVVVVAGVALGAVNVLSPVDTSTTTTIQPASTTTTTIAPSNVTLSAVGDTELGNTPQLPANPSAYLTPIKAALAAPIVFGNLEGTITSAAASKCSPTSTNCYAFHVPTADAAVYRAAGFTVMNSANNHSHDFGYQGALDTTTALRAAGIAQAGLPGQIAVVREGTTRVAFVGFAPYANTNDLLNLTGAAQLIAQAKRIADVVVVYMHAGAEGSIADHVTRASEYYVGENRGNPYAFAHAAIDDGADLVIASGPHALRGMEWYRGHLIAYSLGDFANYYDFASYGTLRLSAILHVTLSSSGSFLSGHFTSVVLSPSGQPSVDPTDAAAALVNQLSVADFAASAARVAPNGTVVVPTR
jgi:poly-gamma-glutamate capsule biosynthesis protein CapA/YwtB (metallophosphatase superfamily)